MVECTGFENRHGATHQRFESSRLRLYMEASFIPQEFKHERFWFEQLVGFLLPGRTLKIGNGLGHLSEAIRTRVSQLDILDICLFPQTINKDKVKLYGGSRIPYPDNFFESVIIVFTLHHIPDSSDYFKEMLRVTRTRIILTEETFDSVPQKMHLYYRDWYYNRVLRQTCPLYWNSYFSRKKLDQLIAGCGLQQTHRVTRRHRSYFREMVVLDKPLESPSPLPLREEFLSGAH